MLSVQCYVTRKANWKTHQCLKSTPKDTELNWVDAPSTRTYLLSLMTSRLPFPCCSLLCVLLFCLYVTIFLHLKDWVTNFFLRHVREHAGWQRHTKKALSGIDYKRPHASVLRNLANCSYHVLQLLRKGTPVECTTKQKDIWKTLLFCF